MDGQQGQAGGVGRQDAGERAALYVCDPLGPPPRRRWWLFDAASLAFLALVVTGTAGSAFALVMTGETWGRLAGLAVAAAGGACAQREWGGGHR